METKIIPPKDIWLLKDSLLAKLPLVFFSLGLICLIYWASIFEANRTESIFGYLFGFIVTLSLALGSMAFVLIQHLTRAGWSVVIRRIPETVISLMPLFILFFIPILLNIHEIFPWSHPEHIDETLVKKLPYLNQKFFLIRSFFYLLSWSVIGIWYFKVSVAQDNNNKPELTKNMQAASAVSIIVFGLTLTFASFDWLMSLQPHWYSTIFGVYFFSGCYLFALAFMTLIIMLLQSTGVLLAVTPEHYHDLGKLLFGFTVFWAYISFSQFMLYWYGGIPEEIEFYTHRLNHGFANLSWAMPIIHFFVPFFLLMSRTLKRIKIILAFNCLWIIAVHFIDMYWLIMPTMPNAHMHISLEDFLGFAGIFFCFFGLFLFMLSRNSLLAKGDPRLPESLAFENF